MVVTVFLGKMYLQQNTQEPAHNQDIVAYLYINQLHNFFYELFKMLYLCLFDLNKMFDSQRKTRFSHLHLVYFQCLNFAYTKRALNCKKNIIRTFP